MFGIGKINYQIPRLRLTMNAFKVEGMPAELEVRWEIGRSVGELRTT